MPSPISFLDAVVSTLQTELAQHSVLPAAIRAQDWDVDDDRRLLTDGDPFVLVALKGLQGSDEQDGAPRAYVTVAVYVGARAGRSKDADLSAELNSSGDVAAFLAAEIVRLAMTQTWGSSAVCGYAERVKAASASTADRSKTGLSMWAVFWNQPVELGDSAAAILGPLSLIHHEVNVDGGTDDTVPVEYDTVL